MISFRKRRVLRVKTSIFSNAINLFIKAAESLEFLYQYSSRFNLYIEFIYRSRRAQRVQKLDRNPTQQWRTLWNLMSGVVKFGPETQHITGVKKTQPVAQVVLSIYPSENSIDGALQITTVYLIVYKKHCLQKSNVELQIKLLNDLNTLIPGSCLTMSLAFI